MKRYFMVMTMVGCILTGYAQTAKEMYEAQQYMKPNNYSDFSMEKGQDSLAEALAFHLDPFPHIVITEPLLNLFQSQTRLKSHFQVDLEVFFQTNGQ